MGSPLTQLHHEVGPAAVGRAGVKHARDVRMIHHRQGLPLGLEPRDDLMRVHAGLDDLERHRAPDRLVLLSGVDDAEPTGADLVQDVVRTDAESGQSTGDGIGRGAARGGDLVRVVVH